MSTKDKIMESTFRLLLKKGYIEVSLSEIVKESQVGYGSIYYYFEDKDQLIQCVLNRYIIDMFLNQLDTVKLSNDLLSNLNEFYHRVLGLKEDNSYISYNDISIDNIAFKKMILLTFEGQQKYEKEQSYFRKYNEKFTEIVEKIIRIGIENDEINKDINLEKIVFFIKSNIYGIFFLWLVEDIDDVNSSIETNIEYLLPILK
ncbi:TetR/AcrR family transcriptional regulator [uncultured Methanobrevibacter sp.]|uniref:TetR/AcrR family transcriptional regulator n=1 Tax=uncultured Methanobrevibacter sp. TaxID=253161 RepID=UPI0026229C9A